MLLLTICRAAFLWSNYSLFNSFPFSEILFSFLVGLRFDLVSLCILLSPMFVMHLIPVSLFAQRVPFKLTSVYFFIVTAICILVNLIDAGYYTYSGKRSTFDFFEVLGTNTDILATIPNMLTDHIDLLIVLVILFYALYKVSSYKRIFKTKFSPSKVIAIKMLLLLGWIIGFRGGIQLKPLKISSAAKYTSAELAPLTLNTAFCMIKTSYGSSIQNIAYMSESERIKVFSTQRNYISDQAFSPKNVVIIILESFSSEYSSFLNKSVTGYMPFLDSLMQVSYTCTNAFANGKRSIEALPAILSSIPVLMPEPFITSNYNSITVSSPAKLLKGKKYSSAFFHGGANGTMGFDNFIAGAGFEKYVGKNQFADERHFDGKWGIYDEPFLLFSLKELNELPQPFCTSIFTLSSHHPYSIPEKYNTRFQEGRLPIHRSISYADYSIRMFFESARQYSWFSNTLFIITADHTGPSEYAGNNFIQNTFSIPLLLYCPSDSTLQGLNNIAVQQIDILPTILDYLHFDHSFFSFGNSIFRKKSEPLIFFTNDNHYLLDDDEILSFNQECNPINSTSYNHRESDKIEKYLKAYRQAYNSKLIQNKLNTP